jgi:hypothetical protein
LLAWLGNHATSARARIGLNPDKIDHGSGNPTPDKVRERCDTAPRKGLIRLRITLLLILSIVARRRRKTKAIATVSHRPRVSRFLGGTLRCEDVDVVKPPTHVRFTCGAGKEREFVFRTNKKKIHLWGIRTLLIGISFRFALFRRAVSLWA